MKKFFITLVAALIAAPSFAQYSSGGFELDKESVYYGVRLGMTSANMGGDYDSMDSKIGMTLGGVVGLRLSESTPVFLESGVYYSERGAKEGKYKISYNNIDIPLLIKYGFKAEKVAILPYLGPYIGLAVTKDVKNFDKLTMKGKYPESDDINRRNMGFKFGCGVEYNMLYAEVGYQWCITDISDNETALHANALYINIGVNF